MDGAAAGHFSSPRGVARGVREDLLGPVLNFWDPRVGISSSIGRRGVHTEVLGLLSVLEGAVPSFLAAVPVVEAGPRPGVSTFFDRGPSGTDIGAKNSDRGAGEFSTAAPGSDRGGEIFGTAPKISGTGAKKSGTAAPAG